MCVNVNVFLVLYTSQRERERDCLVTEAMPRTIKQQITAADEAFRKTTDEVEVTLK